MLGIAFRSCISNPACFDDTVSISLKRTFPSPCQDYRILILLRYLLPTLILQCEVKNFMLENSFYFGMTTGNAL